jgi:hypothetical protein
MNDNVAPKVIETFEYGETRDKLLVKLKNGLPDGMTDNEELKAETMSDSENGKFKGWVYSAPLTGRDPY